MIIVKEDARLICSSSNKSRGKKNEDKGQRDLEGIERFQSTTITKAEIDLRTNSRDNFERL